MKPITFDVKTPRSGAVLRWNTAQALALDLPSATPEPKALRIIAGGPTALEAPLHGGDTLALNGALRLYGETGPTYWAACDPQECVADFVRSAPRNTIYLVAAQCHPSVFAALEGRDVRVWNVDCPDTRSLTPDGVPTAVSITLVAMQLMARLGYRRFETWGWDGCYFDGKSHASEQAHNADDITVRLEGREGLFETTSTWAAEAQDAVTLLATADFKVDVKGGGMFAAILDAKLKGR